MITKVVINNNGDTPIEYLSGLGAFRNGNVLQECDSTTFELIKQ